MKKTIKQKTKKELEKITGFTWRTSEEVYRKASKNKAFTQAYKEETARLAKQGMKDKLLVLIPSPQVDA